MLIDQIKTYACAATVISLLTVAGMTKWQLHSVEKEYKTYKDSINAQLTKSKIDKARIEAEQKAKLDKATSDYDTDRARLADIIRRLRESRTMPRQPSMPLAGSSADSMSRKTANPERFTATSTPATRTGFTYEDAMMDTLMCSKLIEFVKP